MPPVKLGVRLRCCVPAALLGFVVAGGPARAQKVMGTPEQTNDRIRALSSEARITPHDYIIGAGDTLTVDVFDVKELSRDVRVSQTGTIALPLVPVRLQVKGLTETQTEQKIAEVLQANGLVSHPEVSVAVKDRRSKPITVVGAVPRPMVYQAERPVTLLEVLAEAGGVSNDAGDTAIVTRPRADQNDAAETPPMITEDVIPPGGEKEAPPSVAPAVASSGATASVSSVNPTVNTPIFATGGPGRADKAAATPGQVAALPNTITVNLNDLMESGDPTNNVILQAGDIVTVPHAGIVYILGAITKPGGYVLANDRSQMTTLKMLALSGGFNRTAKSDHAVIIRRDLQGQQHEQIVDLKKIVKREAEDVRLQASDILYVPDSAAKQALIKASEIALTLASGVALYRVAYR
ncbi:MAG: polysaccharide biosynthesis/export family protein [Acidobacteriota bacterium]|nr:polysaccharide biosynthesis/export family protein [Acidobacteriota bacterium]